MQWQTDFPEDYNTGDDVDWIGYFKEINITEKELLKIVSKEERIITDQVLVPHHQIRQYEQLELRSYLNSHKLLTQKYITLDPKEDSIVVFENNKLTQEFISKTKNFKDFYKAMISFFDDLSHIYKTATESISSVNFSLDNKEDYLKIKNILNSVYNPGRGEIKICTDANWKINRLVEHAGLAKKASREKSRNMFGSSWSNVLKNLNIRNLKRIFKFKDSLGEEVFALLQNLFVLGDICHLQKGLKQIPLINPIELGCSSRDTNKLKEHIFNKFSLMDYRTKSKAPSLRSFKGGERNIMNVCELIKYRMRELYMSKKYNHNYVAIGNEREYYLITDSKPIKSFVEADQDVAPTHVGFVLKDFVMPQSMDKFLNLYNFEYKKIFGLFAA